MSFGTVAILGPGLIGGSLALALAERNLADKLVIYARKKDSFPAIQEKLPQVTLTTDVVEAVRDADIVVLCVPIETMKGLVEKFVHVLKPTALVTDVGSVKGSVEKEIAPLLEGKALWIGSHPMAGSEKSGFAAARVDLFNGATVILTPTEKTNSKTEQLAKRFWEIIVVDGRVGWIDAEYHDLVIAEISHVPHLLASLLLYKLTDEARVIAPGLSKMPYTPDKALEFAGPGFRDTTRIASGSPDLWTEILWNNREAVTSHLDALVQILTNIKNLLNEPNPQKGKSEICLILKIAQARRADLLELNNKVISSS